MRITGISTRLVAIDPRPRYKDGRIPPGRPAVWLHPILTVQTDSGIDGFSTGYGPHGDGPALVQMLHAVFEADLVGMDPLAGEAIWQKLWTKQRHLYNQRETLLGMIDVALWDIRGKAAGLPIARLLGLHRDRMPCYASGRSEFFDADEIGREAAGIKAAGFHGYKMQLRSGPAKDIPRLRAAREAVGPDFLLMQDAVAAYDYSAALEVGRMLDDLNFHWYEEPVPDQNLDAIARLAAKVRTPLLVGETARLTDLPRYLGPSGAAMLRGDTLMKGGITGLRKAMALAELHGVSLEIHTANSPLLDVANLHVACASANTRFIENHHPIFRWGLKSHPIDVGPDGCAHLPDAPGLGVEIDWDWIENHTHTAS